MSGRTSTFYEFTPTTKARWERIARKASALAHYEADADAERIWTKDEVIEHIRQVMADDGDELDERRAGMYLERMKLASVFSGPEQPTLDLVQSPSGNGMGYQWIRNGAIPTGFLRHVLAVVGAMPRIAFDYFVLTARKYSLEELVEGIGPRHAMTLLLLAELYIRVYRSSDPVEILDQYIERINDFKSELQGKITQAEAEGLQSLATALLANPSG